MPKVSSLASVCPHLINGEGDDVVDEDDRLHDAEEDVDDGHDDPRGGRWTRSKRWKDAEGALVEHKGH